jgi:hypothetical protein
MAEGRKAKAVEEAMSNVNEMARRIGRWMYSELSRLMIVARRQEEKALLPLLGCQRAGWSVDDDD